MPHNLLIFGTLQNITPTTSTPTINPPYFTINGWRYNVKNNDESTATIYADHNGTNPPTTSRGSVASGANCTLINTGYTSELIGFTVYARAQASGENMSAVVSYYQAGG